ncbi:MAG TPA: SulP family inorganic anion transporter [bacterium]|jgi:SulP family sulfate permease|nr:SulP family inorganic anion transporter [bacterium]
MERILKEFSLRRLFPSLVTGLIAGVLAIIIETSLAALIFSGDLSPHVGRGIGFTLFGAFAIAFVVAITTSVAGAIAISQDTTTAVLALVAASIASGMGELAASEVVFWTVIAAIAVTSLLTGLFFLALGRYKLSGFIRFVPYPVTGGFLAGTGWLLMQGGINVMTGAPLSFAHLPRLFQLGILPLWLPGVIFGVIVLIVSRRFNHFVVMPALLVAAIAVFYGALLFTNTSLADARAGGWLLGPFPPGALWSPPTPAALAQVDWSVIFAQTDKLATILVIGAIAFLLNASGLELTIRQDIDLNRELQSAGLANLVASVGGGPVGYHTLSLSALAFRLGANSRLAGLSTAGVCGVALFFGAGLFSFFPKPVLGGFLFFLGASFLVEWLYDAWFKLPRTDYVLVLLILAAISSVNFLAGVGVGVAVAIVLFVVNYSRINIVKHALSGGNYQSNVERSASDREVLQETGDQLLILRLQGYIFFGTAQNLLNQIRQRAEHSALRPLRYVVLEFRRVNGLDSSAVSSFVRIKQWAETKNFQLVFTQLPPGMRKQLEMGGLAEGRGSVVNFFPTLDYGIEWCENRILIDEHMSVEVDHDSLPVQLARLLPKSVDVSRLMTYLERHEVSEGYYLMRQGEAPEAMYFIESGQLTAQLELPDGRAIRLRTMRGGTVVGEIPMYIGGARTASVVTISPSAFYRLSATKLKEMEQDDPDLAAALHKFIAGLLAERLAGLNRTLEAVLD